MKRVSYHKIVQHPSNYHNKIGMDFDGDYFRVHQSVMKHLLKIAGYTKSDPPNLEGLAEFEYVNSCGTGQDYKSLPEIDKERFRDMVRIRFDKYIEAHNKKNQPYVFTEGP